jgi:hypothetical protein
MDVCPVELHEFNFPPWLRNHEVNWSSCKRGNWYVVEESKVDPHGICNISTDVNGKNGPFLLSCLISGLCRLGTYQLCGIVHKICVDPSLASSRNRNKWSVTMGHIWRIEAL